MLRHGVGSLLADQGVSVALIARQLRHGDNGITAQRFYVHPDVPDAEALDVLGGER
jgi:hypothetical protein